VELAIFVNDLRELNIKLYLDRNSDNLSRALKKAEW